MFTYWDRKGNQGGAKVCAALRGLSPWMGDGGQQLKQAAMTKNEVVTFHFP